MFFDRKKSARDEGRIHPEDHSWDVYTTETKSGSRVAGRFDPHHFGLAPPKQREELIAELKVKAAEFYEAEGYWLDADNLNDVRFVYHTLCGGLVQVNDIEDVLETVREEGEQRRKEGMKDLALLAVALVTVAFLLVHGAIGLLTLPPTNFARYTGDRMVTIRLADGNALRDLTPRPQPEAQQIFLNMYLFQEAQGNPESSGPFLIEEGSSLWPTPLKPRAAMP